jgi:branched-chain amino acid transport system ATP-binding protein
MLLLEIESLTVRYDGIIAVKEISLLVKKQEIVILIGSNGAGKSSFLRALFNLVPADFNKLIINGIDAIKLNTRERILAGMALVPETRDIFPKMTVEDNLKLGLFLNKAESGFKNELDRIAALFPILAERLKQRAGTLSGGEQQMLALGRALMQKPQLLCLDEPSLGLAPKIVDSLYEMLQKVSSSDVSILLVEQQARRALEFGQRGYVMHLGTIVQSASCKELCKDSFVRNAYMGRSSYSKSLH